MKAIGRRGARWAGIVAMGLFLAACGGGGGGGSGLTPVTAAAPPTDARNGSYTLYAADAHEYTLALDFDAKTYQLNGNGVAESGTFTQQGAAYMFPVGNASGATGQSTTRFLVGTDTVVGEIKLVSGVLPFVAARKFVQTIADAKGTYNFLSRDVDTSGGPADSEIQQAEITADGHLRICDDLLIYTIKDCPAASVNTGTVTVAGDLFTATTQGGTIPFRVAQVGSDKVFLRASGSLPPRRRLVIGVPATATFDSGTFVGGTTDPSWGTMTIQPDAFSSTFIPPTGVPGNYSQSAFRVSPSIEGIRAIDPNQTGFYFTTRSSELAVVVASRGNPITPGLMAIGVKQ
jgi:hypothetical protein